MVGLDVTLELGNGSSDFLLGWLGWLAGSFRWKNGMPVGPKVPWARSGFGGGDGMAILGIRDFLFVVPFFLAGFRQNFFSVNLGPADAGLMPSSCGEKGYA